MDTLGGINMGVFTAQATMRGLKERLDLTLAGETYVEALDADGNPILVVTAASEKSFIKISTLPNPGRVDGLGLAQKVYSPHTCTVILEDSATADVAALPARYKILAQVLKLGMQVEVQEGPGVATAADYAAADALGVVITTIRSNEIHPLTLSM